MLLPGFKLCLLLEVLSYFFTFFILPTTGVQSVEYGTNQKTHNICPRLYMRHLNGIGHSLARDNAVSYLHVCTKEASWNKFGVLTFMAEAMWVWMKYLMLLIVFCQHIDWYLILNNMVKRGYIILCETVWFSLICVSQLVITWRQTEYFASSSRLIFPCLSSRLHHFRMFGQEILDE